jgi:hypothetical protein
MDGADDRDDAAGKWEELEATELTDREIVLRASQAQPDTADPNDPEVG